MKVSTQYVCSSCGAKAPQMIGRCPVCGEWGTYEEEVSVSTSAKKGGAGLRRGAKAQLLHEIDAKEDMRIDMQSAELNRVLGGGLVPGSLVLLGGEPGIGKSTLALQVLLKMGGRKTLYASGEESIKQLKLRAERFVMRVIKSRFKSLELNLMMMLIAS